MPGPTRLLLGDVLLVGLVMIALALGTFAFWMRFPRAVRPWMLLAFIEYQACAWYQYYNGADANGYREVGTELARFLDANFRWAAPEVLSLMLHQPSAFDINAIGPGTNTGSMCAAAAWIIFFVRGSAYAAQALVAGLAMLGAFGVFAAFHRANPDIPPFRVFLATVLFPSVAFWVAALHKEALCLMGMGLVLVGWGWLQDGVSRWRGAILAFVGLAMIGMFRPPVLAPLLLGLIAYFVLDRGRRTGRGSVFSRPRYLVLGLVLATSGLFAVGRIAPDLALDRLVDTVATQQVGWINISNGKFGAGGSAFDLEDPVERSLSGQVAQAPISFVNALFRPQFFDVHNISQGVSALEMTALTLLFVVAIRRHGFVGLVKQVNESPFLLMCAVVTLIGCTFVGLTTRNFGTLARYRVPFLPFYGMLLARLTMPMRKKANEPTSNPLPRARPRGAATVLAQRGLRSATQRR